jgi:hypothetical protein
LAFDPDLMFSVMEKAYRTGLFDKMNVIMGEALGEVIKKHGLNMEELINRMDGAKEETVQKMDRALSHSTLMLKLAGNEKMMVMMSKLMDVALVHKLSVKGMAFFLERTMAKADGTLPPLKEQLKGFLAARKDKALATTGRGR